MKNKEVNPGLFGNPVTQSNMNSNLGVKTPQIFVENKINSTNSKTNIDLNSNSHNNDKNSSKVDNFIDKSTEKAFDALWENEKFQKGMKDGAKNLAYNTVSSQIPIKQEPGVQHPLGNVAAKMTEKAFENDKFQKGLKDAAKNATSNAIKKEVNMKPPEKKKGLFSFI